MSITNGRWLRVGRAIAGHAVLLAILLAGIAWADGPVFDIFLDLLGVLR